MDSVFIFQSFAEETPSASYDAIVVEQWTVVDVRISVLLSNMTRANGVRPHDSFYPPPPQGRRREGGLRPLAPVAGPVRLEADVRVAHADCQDQQVSRFCARKENNTFFLAPIISNNVASTQPGLITPPVSFLLGNLGLNAVA